MSAAAFFDLDRTLLPGASGREFSAALREAGVLGSEPVPGEAFAFGLFDLIGETAPSMLLARRAARMAEGWDVTAVEAAGAVAATRLLSRVQPYARQELVRHQREGRRLVVATTSPRELAAPLAAALGFDDVIATRYGRADGRYDGTVDGHFVWGKGKLAAVRDWAAAEACDLGECWAYSDSYYDLPLLGAVGSPVAVNPDPRLAVAATARRWPIRFLDAPEGVPRLGGVGPEQALLALVRPETILYARFDIAGVEHIPSTGPAIVAANHRSYFDVIALSVATGRAGRVGRFVGKREVFDAPVIGRVATALGGIAVDRGSGSDAPLRAAADALDAGDIVTILPQGTIPRGHAFFEPELRGRSGVARLAAMTGAPVVPVSVWGTERVWPRSARLPNLLNIVRPPTVRIRVGEPLELPDGISAADGTELVMSSIYDLMPVEGKTRRTPTAEELARSLPPGTDVPRGPDGTGGDG